MDFLRALIFPGGVVLAAAIAVHRWAPGEAVASMAPILFYVALAVGLLLAWNYNRSRAVALLVMFVLTLWFLPELYAANGDARFRAQTICLLIPLNSVFLALWNDRAVLAPSGVLTLGLLGAQCVFLAMLPLVGSTRWGAFAAGALSQRAWTGIWIGQLGLTAFAVALLALVLVFFRRRTPMERGMVWALAAVWLACATAKLAAVSTLYFGAAALIVGISVLEHAHAIAYRDELTGLASRRALNEFLPRLSGTFSVAMVDVDHFKQFNDTYGHDVGDEVLRMVAGKLESLEGTGRVYRYGGEEFIVVFPTFTEEQAEPFVESLRASIENTRFQVRGPERRSAKAAPTSGLRARGPERRTRKSRGRGTPGVESVTVSIGLAERTDARSSPEQVITAADKALYQAKRSGRNRVVSV